MVVSVVIMIVDRDALPKSSRRSTSFEDSGNSDNNTFCNSNNCILDCNIYSIISHNWKELEGHECFFQCLNYCSFSFYLMFFLGTDVNYDDNVLQTRQLE